MDGKTTKFVQTCRLTIDELKLRQNQDAVRATWRLIAVARQRPVNLPMQACLQKIREKCLDVRG